VLVTGHKLFPIQQQKLDVVLLKLFAQVICGHLFAIILQVETLLVIRFILLFEYQYLS